MTSAEPRARMLAGLPVTARAIDVDGISTAIISIGDGPPLLLLHGGIECGAAMWAPVLGQLATRNRVVAPDVPGLGESEAVDRLDIDTFGRWLAAVIEEMGLERPTLVAHSLIGSLAARFAVRDDQHIGRLVIYAAPAIGSYRMPWRLRYVAIRFAIRPTPRNAERFDRFALLDIDATRRRDAEWFDAFQTYTLERARQRHVQKTMRQLVGSQTKRIPDAELERIRVPTTLLWGRHDRMVPPSVAAAVAERLNWPLHIIDAAAHAPHIEQPDAFVTTLETMAASG